MIPESVTTIGRLAFYNCKELEYISFPNSLKKIDVSAFEGCEKLSLISFSNNIEELGSAVFRNCTGLKKILIPGCIKQIGYYVFYDCSNLVEVIIEDGITEIPNSMFTGCTNIESITIPSSIKKVGYSAFSGCGNLDKFYCHAIDVPNIESGVKRSIFHNSYIQYATLYKYRAESPWNEFGNILAIESSGISTVNNTDAQFDVYNLNGQRLKSKTTTFGGLPSGLYIVNGNKVLKK